MTKIAPAPRSYPRATPTMGEAGTWLEAEELAYPHGGQTRRCRALCTVDGVTRVVRVGIPDTYFSIPGHATIGGKRRRGFVTYDAGTFLFHCTPVD